MKTSILALENYLPKNSINELYFPYDALGAPVLQFQPIFYSFLEKRENWVMFDFSSPNRPQM